MSLPAWAVLALRQRAQPGRHWHELADTGLECPPQSARRVLLALWRKSFDAMHSEAACVCVALRQLRAQRKLEPVLLHAAQHCALLDADTRLSAESTERLRRLVIAIGASESAFAAVRGV